MKNYNSARAKITTLTPVLIGQETEQAGLSYYSKGNHMVRVNFEKFLESMDFPREKSIIEKIVNNIMKYTGGTGKSTLGDIKKVLENTQKSIEKPEFEEYEIENNSSEAIRLMASIEITAKIRNKPYIPGSSLKGAIQTAKTSKEKVSSLDSHMTKYKDIDKSLKTGFQKSSFGVRDSSLGREENLFFSNISIVSYKSERTFPRAIPSKVFKPQQKAAVFCEAIKPGSVFYSNFLFEEKRMLDKLVEAIIKKSTFVAESELRFYEEIYGKCAKDKRISVEKILETYEDIVDLLKENICILRVGRGSGFKSTSALFCEEIKGKEGLIDAVLPSKTPGRNGRQIKRSQQLFKKVNSRQLVRYQKEYWPFGWIKLEF